MAKKPETRISRLLESQAFASIQKQFGASAITLATEKKVDHVPRLSSRILQLDYALGGGWPIGRINTIYGHKSTGKSTLCTLAAASAQQTCRTCLTPIGPPDGMCQCGKFADMSVVYIDVEGTYEGGWGRNLGCDPEKLLISRPDYAEQALDILEALIRSQECDVIILDSIAFLTPAKEIEKSVAEDMVGAQARVSGKAVRKFVAAMNAVGNQQGGWKPTIFLTNQIRMKVGLLFGNPETQPGGLAWGFAASNEVRVNNGKYKMDEDSGRPLYVDIPFKVDKNKTGVPKMEGNFRMMLSDTETKVKGQIADEGFILTQLERLGILTGGGSSWKIGDETWKGKKYIEQQLATDPVFSHKIRNMLMTVLLAA
jgi:recombination protein RecA